jgi:hypothetical protein
MNAASSNIALPAPSSVLDGTTYTLINTHATNTKALNRNYRLIGGGTSSTLPNSTSITIQRFGSDWVQLR